MFLLGPSMLPCEEVSMVSLRYANEEDIMSTPRKDDVSNMKMDSNFPRSRNEIREKYKEKICNHRLVMGLHGKSLYRRLAG